MAVPIATRRDLKQSNQSIYLHSSGPLLENGLDRPKNRYARYGFSLVFTAFSCLP